MTIVEFAANVLNIKPNELMKISLEAFLKQKLAQLEADIYLICKKFGIKDIYEFDKLVKEGKLKEEVAYDDYFTLDNLIAEREKVKKVIDKL